ncbi:MAG: IS1182 family transposase [Nanoarchaeota archaeon]|nr:IS1182 family transposase [Nanoarchaeota archaeon]
MGFIYNERNQMNLLGYSIDEFVSHNAKCRFIVKLISKLDLNPLYQRYSDQGADAYDPGIMLSTWFFAYSERQTSTRKLEELCKRDLHYIYISSDLRPDHSSFSRFRKDNLDLISSYFIQLIQLAKEENVSDFRQISIDGSKFNANSSAKKNKTEDNLIKEMASVRRQIDEYMKRCDIEEVKEMDENDLENIREKINKLKKIEKTMKSRGEQLEKRKKEIKPEHRKKHKINITEPEAYIMNGVNGRNNRPAYNAQISTDTETHLIVANEIVQERNDKNQFLSQHRQIKENLGYRKDRKYNADSGYHSLEQLESIYKEEIDAVIADPAEKQRSRKGRLPGLKRIKREGRKLERGDFKYNKKEDYYVCAARKKLKLIKRDKNNVNIYQSKGCEGCELISQCLTEKNRSGRRNIRRDGREIYAELMNEKLKTEEAKERLKIRATTVEPVFGNLKENMGFRKFRLRGLRNVKGEFNLMCIAHNINILYKLLGSKLDLAAGKIKLYSKIFLKLFFNRNSTFLVEFQNI